MYGALTVFAGLLKLTGLYRWGQRNFRNIQTVRNQFSVPHLPAPFNGFTLLQLSDLHLDIDPGLPEALIERLKTVPKHDICVITGDYRWKTTGSHERCMAEMGRIRKHLHKPVYAILGNHDFLEMVPVLEQLGIEVLLNETVAVQRSGSTLHLVGTDDPHFYLLDNLEKATNSITDPEAVKILLTHSPETYKKAAHLGFDVMLCGHTHGGQICLPGGFAPLLNANVPRHLCSGRWKHLDLQGYTSRGTGGSGIPVRYFCPPEITLHRLVQASQSTDIVSPNE